MDIKIIIFEDNSELRDSLNMLLKGTSGIEVLATFSNCQNIEKNISYFKPNVILMDIDMPVVNGIEGLKIINQKFKDINVIMLTVFESNEHIFEAICLGAVGYLLKNSSPLEIISAIKDVHLGGSPMSPSVARKVLQFFPKKQTIDVLSDREIEVLRLLTKGFTYRMAAYELGIGVETIRTYIKRIYTKLHVQSNTEAVAIAIKNNLVKD